MTILEKINKLMNSISTQPNKRSWRWGNSRSFLALILLYAVYILRVLSLLQILKRIYRGLKSRKNAADRDLASKRINVPPLFVEIYFISFITLLTAIYLYSNSSDIDFLSIQYPVLFSCLNGIVNFICYYFLIESSIWVLYYFVLRRFFEEKYAIMHALEYIILIPIIIIGQGLCFSLTNHVSFVEGVSLILNPTYSTPNYICILNILYMAVVVGVVINALPSERIKEKGKNKYDLSIIGAGDVVVNRLIPALERMQRRLNVIIYDIDDSRIEKNRRDCINGNTFTYKIKDENFKKNALNSSIVWIATPSSTHLTYLEEFVNKNAFVAIEKAINFFEIRI